MRFMRFPARGVRFPARTVVVDSVGRMGLHRDGAALVLSHHHWAGSPVSDMGARVKGDSSTDEVLGWLWSGRGAAPPVVDEYDFVTADHYDIDSALSAYCLLCPAAAAAYAELLSAASNLGDFRHYAHCAHHNALFDAALRLCCALNTAERDVFGSKPFAGRAGRDGAAGAVTRSASTERTDVGVEGVDEEMHMLRSLSAGVDAAGTAATDDVEGTKLQGMVEVVLPYLLPPPEGVDGVSHSARNTTIASDSPAAGAVPALPCTHEYLRVKRELAENAGGARVLTVHPELGVAVVERGEPCHYYSLFAGTEQCDVVVSVYSGRRYEVEQKYTAFVRTQRPTLPRAGLAGLAEELNALEAAHGSASTDELRWRADPVTDTGPLLRIDRVNERLSKVVRYDHPAGRPIYPSAIPSDVFTATVLAYHKRCLHGAPSAVYHSVRDTLQFQKRLAAGAAHA